MKRPQKLAVMLVPTPPYEICGLGVAHTMTDSRKMCELVLVISTCLLHAGCSGLRPGGLSPGSRDGSGFARIKVGGGRSAAGTPKIDPAALRT